MFIFSEILIPPYHNQVVDGLLWKQIGKRKALTGRLLGTILVIDNLLSSRNFPDVSLVVNGARISFFLFTI